MAKTVGSINFLIPGIRDAELGTVEVYEVGTTNRKTIYTDQDLATGAKTTDIQLDTRGAVTGSTMYYTDGEIKIVIKNKDGNILYTKDNILIGSINTFDSSSYADLVAAVAAIGVTEGDLVINGQMLVEDGSGDDAAVTVPETLRLVFGRGGSLDFNGTETVTINGDIQAGNHQIFTVSSGTFTGRVTYSEGKASTAWFGDFQDAVLALGTTAESHLVVESNYTLTANVTIDEKMHLEFTRDGKITASGGFTLDIDGSVEAGLFPIFASFPAGDITFGKGRVKEVEASWFGVTGDDTTDDRAAWVSTFAAIDSPNIVIKTPTNGVSTMSGNNLTWPSQENITLDGRGNFIFECSGMTAGQYCIELSGSKNPTIRNITFQGGTSTATRAGNGLDTVGTGTAGIKIENCNFIYLVNGLRFKDTIKFRGLNSLYFFDNDIDIIVDGSGTNGICSSFSFSNCSFDESEKNFRIDAGGLIYSGGFINCSFRSKRASETKPIELYNQAGAGTTIWGLSFYGCYFRHADDGGAVSGSYSIWASGLSSAAPIHSLVIRDCTFDSNAATTETHIHVVDYCQDLIIEGNTFIDTPNTADFSYNSTDDDPCYFRNNSANGGRDFTIVNTSGSPIVREDTNATVKWSKEITLDGTATPTVAGGNNFTYGGATTITNFDDGYDGQIITIRATGSFTINNSGFVVLVDADNFEMITRSALTLININSVWYELSRSYDFLFAQKTWDPAALGVNSNDSTTVTVTGAALGDFSAASFSLDLQGLILNSYVSAADTVTVVLSNTAGAGSVDLASGTLKVRVFK